MKATILILALVCLAGVSARTSSGCHPSLYSYVAGKICRSCPSDCATCDSTGKLCTACKGDQEPVDGRCPTSTGLNWSCAESLCDVEGTQGCAICNEGFRFAMKDATTATSYCVACTQAGCADCTVDACNACLDGWFMDTAAKACKQCDTGCVSCTGAGACTECGAAFFTDAGKCTACSTGCVACESATKCTECAGEYLLSSTAFTCTQSPGCETQTEDGTKCSVCKDGYRLVSTDGSCKPCDSNAALCDSAADGSQIIISCGDNFILATKTTAKAAACAARVGGYCIDQNADGGCTKCDSAVGANLTAGTCKACNVIIGGCSKCADGNATDAATCTACSDGYFLNNGNCSPCDSSCQTCTDTTCKCKDGFFDTSPASTKCTSCDAGNAKYGCSLKHAASGCLTGSGEYTHGICFACDPAYKCVTCSSYSVCATCVVGSSVNASKCVVCDANCSSTSGGTAGTGTCATSGSGKCDTGFCKAGFSIDLTKKQCVDKCTVSNCTTCLSTDYAKCDAAGCNAGYYHDAGVCKACTLANCATCSSATVCTKCKDGKYLDLKTPAYCATNCADATYDGTNKIVATNVASCDTASGGTAGTVTVLHCTGTNIPWTNAKQCDAVPTGKYCATLDNDASKCKTCPHSGYILNVDTCVPCSNVATADLTRFASCAFDTGTSAKTQVCNANYVRGGTTDAGSVCFKADPQCTYTTATTSVRDAAVTADGFCAGTCAGGYYLDANTCKACPTGCATCTNATTCQTCGTVGGVTYLKASATANTCVSTKPSKCTTVSPTADVCTACDTGAYLANGSCTGCTAGCTCSASTDTCTGCLAGFTKDTTYTGTSPSQKCVACIKNCNICSAADTCDTCKDGFYKATDSKSCIACPDNSLTCTSATVVTCKNGFLNYVLPNDATGAPINPVKYCVACASNCDACTVDLAGNSVCTKCKVSATAKVYYYLSADAKSCSNDSCAGSDGAKCNKCVYGQKLSATDLKCVDCVADNSCPLSCSSTGGSTGGPTGGSTNNSTSATDSGSKIAFSLFVLAFIAILGHMMI